MPGKVASSTTTAAKSVGAHRMIWESLKRGRSQQTRPDKNPEVPDPDRQIGWLYTEKAYVEVFQLKQTKTRGDNVKNITLKRKFTTKNLPEHQEWTRVFEAATSVREIFWRV